MTQENEGASRRWAYSPALPKERTDVSPAANNRLRQLAFEYIQACREELREYGLSVRSSMELEFTLEDSTGKPAPRAIALHLPERFDKSNAATHALKDVMGRFNPAYAPYIERIHYENTDSGGPLHQRNMPVVPYQYEVNISDPNRAGEFRPETVAMVTAMVKEHALRRALQSCTSLTPFGRAGSDIVPPLIPNFDALPYPVEKAGKDHPYPHHNEITSALHDNVSLYNDNNENMFVASPALLDHCARSLAELQHAAGLAFLPNDNSLRRIGMNTTAPRGIGIAVTHRKDSRPDQYISINVRKFEDVGDIKNSRETRLENRLAGADADPLVCQALTLGALVDAVRRHVHDPAIVPEIKEKSAKNETLVTGKGTFIVDAAPDAPPPRYDIPKKHVELAVRLEGTRRMHNLLGGKFYQAIIHEYAKDAGTSLTQ